MLQNLIKSNTVEVLICKVYFQFEDASEEIDNGNLPSKQSLASESLNVSDIANEGFDYQMS